MQIMETNINTVVANVISAAEALNYNPVRLLSTLIDVESQKIKVEFEDKDGMRGLAIVYMNEDGTLAAPELL